MNSSKTTDPTDDGKRKRQKQGRAIALFSDGTGNSSAKLFKTNVWRMYESIELGDTSVDADQIVYYDEGVGNSGFRPIAILGSVFGVGLRRNVLELYSFLCRNYRSGDRIFIFGFSRGAFTARFLAALIASEGLVPYRSEADLARQVKDAFRAFVGLKGPFWPPMAILLPLWRLLVGSLLLLVRLLPGQHRYERKRNRQVSIRFVGVWDTVAAYGGPIVELVRGFDDWIRPLSFKNQRLPDKVEVARQALALDDERDAFQPVPWDEPFSTSRDRLKQVWFSGMHADVGGGYPDDSLAYVSLAWMMKEAEGAGLELRHEKVLETNRRANAYGPIHNSRAGAGAYYRYQPRVIGAYVQPPPPGTQSVEDPQFSKQGLQPRVWVHESVLHRIKAGTDGYAPTTLPRNFTVVDHGPHDHSLPAADIAALETTANDRADRQEHLRNLVWWRRVLYFSTVAATLGLGTMPLWPDLGEAGLCSDSRCVLSDVYGALRFVLPEFTNPWIKVFSAAPSWTTALIFAIIVFMVASTKVERRLRDGTRELWAQALAGQVTMPRQRSLLRRIRTSRVYQRLLSLLKWNILPTLAGISMLLSIFWALALIATQLRLSFGEGRGLFCKGGQSGPSFFVDDPCNDLGILVQKNQSYEVRIRVTEDWKDGKYLASPVGLRAAEIGPKLPRSHIRVPVGELGAPFRRVVTARYLQPLIEIVDGNSWTTHIVAIKATRYSSSEYRARFNAARTGRLRMFVNDAVPPWPWDASLFYRKGSGRNQGKAVVAVLPVKADAATAAVDAELHRT